MASSIFRSGIYFTYKWTCFHQYDICFCQAMIHLNPQGNDLLLKNFLFLFLFLEEIIPFGIFLSLCPMRIKYTHIGGVAGWRQLGDWELVLKKSVFS